MSREHPEAWIPEQDPVTLAVLGKQIEELSEAIKIATRCVIQGVDQCDPETGTPNRKALQDEIADVFATANIAINHFGLSREAIDERAERKERHLNNWHTLIRAHGIPA